MDGGEARTHAEGPELKDNEGNSKREIQDGAGRVGNLEWHDRGKECLLFKASSSINCSLDRKRQHLVKGAPQTDVFVRGGTFCLPSHSSSNGTATALSPLFFFPPISDHFPPSPLPAPLLVPFFPSFFRRLCLRTVHKSDDRFLPSRSQPVGVARFMSER